MYCVPYGDTFKHEMYSSTRVCISTTHRHTCIIYVKSTNVKIMLKGTGTRDYNWLKVVLNDESWLGESPTDIQKNVNCHFNFILN